MPFLKQNEKMKPTMLLSVTATTTLLLVLLSIHSNAQNLKEQQWENRILIIKTQNKDSKTYHEQIQEFKFVESELINRKFITYYITENEYSMVDHKNSKRNTSGKIARTFSAQFLNSNHPFEVILIGLDGQVKRRQTELLKKETLFKIVDAMPMRKK